MKKLKGFTLSEVVITLIVIGVVAAITVPMLHNNVNNKKWNVARQKALATIGEAFKLATVNGEISPKTPEGIDMTPEYFVTKILPKYLKLEKTCAPADYQKCGFPATVKTSDGTTVTGLTPNNYKWTELSPAKMMNTQPQQPDRYGTFKTPSSIYNITHFFRTLDGFSMAFFYNPHCASNTTEYYSWYTNLFGNTYYIQQAMDVICLMGIYDMNGKQGPNTVGKDIGFIGSFYNSYEVQTAAVLPHSKEKHYSESGLNGATTWDKLNNYCNNLGKEHEWIMPDINELSLILLNYKLIKNIKIPTGQGKFFYSRTPLAGISGYYRDLGFVEGYSGNRYWCYRDYTRESNIGPYVRCVRNTSLK